MLDTLEYEVTYIRRGPQTSPTPVNPQKWWPYRFLSKLGNNPFAFTCTSPNQFTSRKPLRYFRILKGIRDKTLEADPKKAAG